jgi:ABC-type glycerol-3-phosphate transport system substrate-binding protein
MKKLFALLSVLVLASMLLAACGSPATPVAPAATEPPAVATEAPAATEAPEEERVLEIWTHEFPPLQDAMTTKWIPEFEAAHPGVKVKLTAIPFAGVVAYDAKLLAALSGGSGPDLWDMGDWDNKTFMDNSFLAPLDPKIFGYENAQELIDSYPSGTMDIYVRDGNVYGMFSEYNTLALFYNLDMFEEAGIPPLPEDKPVSWDEIAKISEKLYKTDPNTQQPIAMGWQWGFMASYRSPQWYAQNFYELMRQYGQEDIYLDGEPAVNTEAVEKALQQIYDFQYTYKAYDPVFINNWFADFPQNRIGMVLAGTWFAPAIKGNNPDVRFGVAPHPVVDPNDKNTYKNIQWAWGWCVNANKNPEQQQLAQEFMAFILGKKGESEQAAWWFKNLGYMQPSQAFLDSQAFGDTLKENPWMKQWIDAFDMFDIESVPHSYDEAGATLVRAIDRIIYDGMTAEESAALWQAELERLGK